MDLIEVLTNPLFIPLLVSIITIMSNAIFLYWLRRWQYRTEYAITNIEKIYIPLVAELHDRLRTLNNFIQNPKYLNHNFREIDRIKNTGSIEFLRSHDRSLYEKLMRFNNEIRPNFKELADQYSDTEKWIKDEWTSYIEQALSDRKAREYAGTFVAQLIEMSLIVFLLTGNIDEIRRIWNDKLHMFVRTYNLHDPYVKTSKDKVMIAKGVKSPTFDLLDEHIEELVRMSQSKIQQLKESHSQFKAIADQKEVKDLIPSLQKYIRDPIARRFPKTGLSACMHRLSIGCLQF